MDIEIRTDKELEIPYEEKDIDLRSLTRFEGCEEDNTIRLLWGALRKAYRNF